MLQTAIRTADDTESMKNHYPSARLLRQRIEQFTKTVKTSSSIVVTSTLEDVPVELYTMIRWIMAGPADKLQTEVRTTIVDRGALTLSQNLMFGFKSKRQVTSTNRVTRVLDSGLNKLAKTPKYWVWP